MQNYYAAGLKSASTFRVIVAEDDERFRIILEFALQNFGFHHVTLVESAQEALELLDQLRYNFQSAFEG